jgi:hypothetical protein
VDDAPGTTEATRHPGGGFSRAIGGPRRSSLQHRHQVWDNRWLNARTPASHRSKPVIPDNRNGASFSRTSMSPTSVLTVRVFNIGVFNIGDILSLFDPVLIS